MDTLQGRFNNTRPILTPRPPRLERGNVLTGMAGNKFHLVTESTDVYVDGLKSTGTVTSVPTARPTEGATYPDGLGYAIDTYTVGEPLVWVAYSVDDGNGRVLGWRGAITKWRYVWSDQSILLPVDAGGPSAPVYLVTVA